MSTILKMIKSFPRGRTTEEILVLVGAGFDHDKRVAALAETAQLMRDGKVRKDHVGRLLVHVPNLARYKSAERPTGSSEAAEPGGVLTGSAARFFQDRVVKENVVDA